MGVDLNGIVNANVDMDVWIYTKGAGCRFLKTKTAIVDYRKTSNIIRTLVGNKIVDHSDVVGASPVGAAPTTSSFST